MSDVEDVIKDNTPTQRRTQYIKKPTPEEIRKATENINKGAGISPWYMPKAGDQKFIKKGLLPVEIK